MDRKFWPWILESVLRLWRWRAMIPPWHIPPEPLLTSTGLDDQPVLGNFCFPDHEESTRPFPL